MKSIRKKAIIILAIYLGSYLGVMSLIEKPFFGICINKTDSLPYKVFISRPLETLRKFSFVSLHHNATPNLLVKQVVGLAGDEIKYEGNHLFVNEYDCGTAHKLTPIQTGKIPEGYVFLHATHKDSFDSRYQEFGLIPMTQLEEELWPIF